jgi:hypothetical protein
VTNLLLFSLLALLPQGDFTSFSFCRDGLGGTGDVQCIQLDPSGQGTFMLTYADADTLDVELQLSASGTAKFIELLAETDYLAEADSYDSGREVPSLGLKTLKLEGPQGSREAAFYLATPREASELAAFFDRLITQEMLLLDIESALQFDRLGIPERLDQIERDLGRDRLADARRLIPMLERLAADTRVVNYARTTATRLKQEIEAGN